MEQSMPPYELDPQTAAMIAASNEARANGGITESLADERFADRQGTHFYSATSMEGDMPTAEAEVDTEPVDSSPTKIGRRGRKSVGYTGGPVRGDSELDTGEPIPYHQPPVELNAEQKALNRGAVAVIKAQMAARANERARIRPQPEEGSREWFEQLARRGRMTDKQ